MDMNLARRLEFCRNVNGISQADAARKMGIGQSSLSNYENGVREPGSRVIRSMARQYGVSADFLLGLTNETYIRRKGRIILSNDSDM